MQVLCVFMPSKYCLPRRGKTTPSNLNSPSGLSALNLHISLLKTQFQPNPISSFHIIFAVRLDYRRIPHIITRLFQSDMRLVCFPHKLVCHFFFFTAYYRIKLLLAIKQNVKAKRYVIAFFYPVLQYFTVFSGILQRFLSLSRDCYIKQQKVRLFYKQSHFRQIIKPCP